MRQISAGFYNVLKTTSKGKVPVHEFLSRVSNSDEGVEANLSTIFQSVLCMGLSSTGTIEVVN